ncbi:hypothetical protein WICMUC_004415 [Wickerhamomyces mucosus]|uniref:Uncharacterized protein n=1 Tax=Wickerhamomyces mucosus TaxID=1378264 RepID=A0A9P8TBI1_9ASCO|nr:hypothetical protein WICMUC_004415 [Wickerhamomyces mucosus]
MTEDKSKVIDNIKGTIRKLENLLKLQSSNDQDFWYLGIVHIQSAVMASINKEFSKGLFNENFSELGSNLGSALDVIQNTETDLKLQLYKFNETLTRIFNNQNQKNTTSSESYISVQEGGIDGKEFEDLYDSGFILRTLTMILISKLKKLASIIALNDIKLSLLETKLIDQILIKNITNQMLHPFHLKLLNQSQEIMNLTLI